jgi:hypothetical protein
MEISLSNEMIFVFRNVFNDSYYGGFKQTNLSIIPNIFCKLNK